MSFATKGAPQGWLECSGQLVSIRSYPNLFQVLGTTWGGDGVNNFVIPNLNNGQFIRGGGGERWTQLFIMILHLNHQV